MQRKIIVFATVCVLLITAGCNQDDKKFSGSEATGETVKITPESVKESMKNGNGMNR